jgi:hypothetical protein
MNDQTSTRDHVLEAMLLFTMAAAGISTEGETSSRIWDLYFHGTPILPDYAISVLRCIDLLPDVIAILDGPALGLKFD